jgi:3-oxoadipate enol-lactonase
LDFDDTNRLASIHQPTTLAWGDLDGFVTIDDQERLAAAIPGASLVVLPETGHSPHWERPQAVIELVERVARSSV